jgi:hypothetical protein
MVSFTMATAFLNSKSAPARSAVMNELNLVLADRRAGLNLCHANRTVPRGYPRLNGGVATPAPCLQRGDGLDERTVFHV